LGLVGACGNTAASFSRSPLSYTKLVHTANPPCAVRRWSVKPIRIDCTPFLVPKSSRTVWFASVWGVNVVLCFTPSMTPNGALFGDYCMSPAQDIGNRVDFANGVGIKERRCCFTGASALSKKSGQEIGFICKIPLAAGVWPL
jgi:hypothetical protein